MGCFTSEHEAETPGDWNAMAEPHNTPVPGSTPRATSPVHGVVPHHHHHHHPPPPSPPEPSSHPSARSSTRPLILHLGEPILSSITNPNSNASPYQELTAGYQVLHPPAQDRQRARLLQALRDRTWGDFVAVIRPSRDASGDGEMGDWDAELVDSLPASVRVVASAAPGGEGVDVRRLKERGTL